MPDEDTAQASAPGSVPSVHGTRPIRIHRHGPAGDLARQAWKPPSRLVCSIITSPLPSAVKSPTQIPSGWPAGISEPAAAGRGDHPAPVPLRRLRWMRREGCSGRSWTISVTGSGLMSKQKT
jgi:hypothetical protein